MARGSLMTERKSSLALAGELAPGEARKWKVKKTARHLLMAALLYCVLLACIKTAGHHPERMPGDDGHGHGDAGGDALGSLYRTAATEEAEVFPYFKHPPLEDMKPLLSRVWGLVLLLVSPAFASPTFAFPYLRFIRRGVKVVIDTDRVLQPALSGNFPDPGIVRADGDGRYYAFATNSDGVHVPMAVADNPLGSWTRLQGDGMPDLGWTDGTDFWAPDVRTLPDGSYIMYFSGRKPGNRHCIGVARSPSVTGPYKPDPSPWVCHLDMGGSIDPSGFFDERTGKRYVTYKIDGNAVGHGGSCGNTVEPIVDTPLMLQQVDPFDGSTPMGNAMAILHLQPKEDGPVVEAPNIVYVNGVYILFFSTGCFDGDGYKVKYAYAPNVEGPYTRAAETLLETPDLGLRGPGGATSTEDGTLLLALHGYCGNRRCMYVVEYEVEQ